MIALRIVGVFILVDTKPVVATDPRMFIVLPRCQRTYEISVMSHQRLDTKNVTLFLNDTIFF